MDNVPAKKCVRLQRPDRPPICIPISLASEQLNHEGSIYQYVGTEDGETIYALATEATKRTPIMIDTPELDKLNRASLEINTVNEFLDWLIHDKKIVLSEPTPLHNLQPIGQSIQSLVAEYLCIDLAEVEKERRAVLEAAQENFIPDLKL